MLIPAQQAPAQVSVSLRIGTFYDELTPYGEWVDCRYGECWVPRGVGAGWQPYSNGEWIYTRYGWTWVSSDPWGADPYHYGTWDFVDRYGWVWVPGTIWAPAWVTWSYSDAYVGWAPMPPTVTFGSSGYSGRPIVLGESRYVFVPTNRFVGTNVMSARVEPRRNAEIFRRATHVTRFEVSGGIVRNAAVPLATVQRVTGSRIQTREINTARTTPRTVASGGVARGGHVAIVAPARDVKAAHASRNKAAPQAAPPQPQRQQQPLQREAKPRQEAKPKHESRPQQQEARPQQQVQPRLQQPRPEAKPRANPDPPRVARPDQPGQGREKANPAGKEQGKDRKDEKKDKPGGDNRPG
jgi:hypothetical protein